MQRRPSRYTGVRQRRASGELQWPAATSYSAICTRTTTVGALASDTV
jgi:hypothetical protein